MMWEGGSTNEIREKYNNNIQVPRSKKQQKISTKSKGKWRWNEKKEIEFSKKKKKRKEKEKKNSIQPNHFFFLLSVQFPRHCELDSSIIKKNKERMECETFELFLTEKKKKKIILSVNEKREEKIRVA